MGDVCSRYYQCDWIGAKHCPTSMAWIICWFDARGRFFSTDTLLARSNIRAFWAVYQHVSYDLSSTHSTRYENVLSVSQHHYSGSFCSGNSGLLSDLMAKDGIRGNISLFDSDIAATTALGLTYIFGETNSYSCHGAPGKLIPAYYYRCSTERSTRCFKHCWSRYLGSRLCLASSYAWRTTCLFPRRYRIQV